MNEVLARLHIRAISQVFIAAILLALATHSVEKTMVWWQRMAKESITTPVSQVGHCAGDYLLHNQ